MICPKCQSVMVPVERRGVRFEQCDGCRGIFLDHGELEQIVTAEQTHYGAPGHYEPPPGVAPPGYSGGRGYADSPPPYRRGHESGHYYADSPPPYGRSGHRRRRGFLEELFD